MKTFFAGLLLCFSSITLALDVADFAKSSIYNDAKISPDGKHLAVNFFNGEKNALVFLSTETFKPVGQFSFNNIEEVGRIFWVNNERVVFYVAERKGLWEQPVSYGEIYAVNYDGSQNELIYSYRANDGQNESFSRLKKKKSIRGWGRVIDTLENDDRNILISSRPWGSNISRVGDQHPTAYILDTYTGKIRDKVAYAPSASTSFITDIDGQIRFAYTNSKEYVNETYVRDIDSGEWSLLPESVVGESFWPMAMNSKSDAVYALTYGNNDKYGLHKYNLETGELKEVYTDKEVDITNVQFTTDRRQIYAIRIDPDYPTYLMINKSLPEAQVFRSMLGQFPGQDIRITSQDDEGKKWIVAVTSASNPGTFYLYDKEKNAMQYLFKSFPHIDEQKLAEVKPIQFTASDGKTVNGYLTNPKAKGESAKPMVVLVHGGPHLRDYWTYNREVQLLASQGYSVLQVNFRGSEGYGTAFRNAGYHQWGADIQQDIIDGTLWAVEQGYAVQDKICIMGGSFGAFSAVQSASLQPDLYKCIVANAGVYDLEMMHDEGDIPQAFWGEAYLNMSIGTDPALLRAQSPVTHAAKLKAPVLIAHGEEDERAPLEQAEALIEVLKEAQKPYQTYIKDKEGHGFYSDDNREEYLQLVVDFIGKHLK